jgi:acyl-CoA thioesterase-1
MAPAGVVRGACAYGRRTALAKAALGYAVYRAGSARAQGAAPPLRLLALGDSLTAGYGLPAGQGFVPRLEAALRARGRAVQVLDGGVSGDTTAGGLARLDWALADRPDAAIVELGGNDGLRGLEPRQTGANLAGILDRLAARGVPVLLAGMLAPPNLGADYGREFAEAFHRLARERPGVVFYPFFLEGVAAEPALNQPDRIHPNARGVEEIVRRILPAVEALLDRVPPRPAGGPARSG